VFGFETCGDSVDFDDDRGFGFQLVFGFGAGEDSFERDGDR
jgi:hypothetical protein